MEKNRRPIIERAIKWLTGTGFASILAMVAALVFSVIGWVRTFVSEPKETDRLNQLMFDAIRAGENDTNVLKLQSQVNDLQKTIASLTQIPEQSQVFAMLTKTSEESARNSERLGKLEAVIMQTPDKALAIPLLRKDLDSQRAALLSETSALRTQIDHLYDFNKWFFGLIATMALSSLGFAASQFLKGRKFAEIAAQEDE
jgi:hypothetical protein